MIDTNKPITKILYNGNSMYLYEGEVEGPDKFEQLTNSTLTEITAEDLRGTAIIKRYMFEEQPSLRSIEFSQTVREIKECAFYNCPNLVFDGDFTKTNITIIGPYSFYNTKPTMFKSNKGSTINSNAFRSCPSLKNIYLSYPTILSGEVFFANGEDVDYVFIEEGFTDLSNNSAFAWCVIRKLVFPSTTTTLGQIMGEASVKYLIVKAETPPPITSSYGLGKSIENIFIPTASIPQYQTATNWSTKSNIMYPLVATEADLSTIDTTLYTKACVIVNELGIEDDNNYKIYQYIDEQWNEVIE